MGYEGVAPVNNENPNVLLPPRRERVREKGLIVVNNRMPQPTVYTL